MSIIDGAEAVLDLPQRRVQNQLQDASLLIGEERCERIGSRAEVAIEQANDLRQIGTHRGSLHSRKQACELFPSNLVFRRSVLLRR